MERYQNNVQDQNGNAISAVTVTVRRVSDGAIASIFSDNILTAKANPFTNDADGELFFYAANDRYNIFLTGPITDQKDDVLLLDIETSGNTVRINTDINTATPPTTEAVSGEYLIYDLANDDLLGRIGYAGSNVLRVRNQMEGGGILWQGIDVSSAVQNLITADPDGGADFYYAGTLRLSAGVDSAEVRSNNSTDTETRIVRFKHQDGTDRAFVGHAGADVLLLANQINGGSVHLRAEDAGGNLRRSFDADPDGVTILRGDTNVEIRVAMTAETTSELAILCVANGAVGLYYNNQENFRTSAEAASDIGMGAEVRHNDDNFYPVGMNVLPEDAGLDSGNVTLGLAQIGFMLSYNTGTARSLLFNNVATIKVGSMWSLVVGPSAGTLTGDGGTGVQIRWWNGSTWTTTAAAGNITIGEGQYTIWKETDTLYWISGPTLS